MRPIIWFRAKLLDSARSPLPSRLRGLWAPIKGGFKASSTKVGTTLRYSIVLRSVLLAMTLVLGTTFLVGVVAWQGAYAFIGSVTAERLGQGDDAFVTFTKQRARDLETTALWLSKDPTVLSYASGKGGDPQPLLDRLLPLGNADFYGVQSRYGEMLVVPKELASIAKGEASRNGGRPAPRSGDGPIGGVIQGRDGTLQWRLEVPLEGGGQVLVGYVLGHAFSDQFKAWTGLDMSLYLGEQIVGTSLRSPQGGRATGIQLGKEIANNTLAGGSASSTSFSLGPISYQTYYFPLYDRSGQLIGMYAVALPFSVPWTEQIRILRESLPFLLQLIAIAALSSHLLARQVVAPLRNLSSAVSRMGEGDLSTPIEAAPNHEALPLAQELEEMRQKLHSALNQLAIEKSLYQGIFQSMADGVFTTDKDGKVTSFNPSAQFLLQEDSALGLGQPCCGFSSLLDKEGRPLCDMACLWPWMNGVREPLSVKGRLSSDGQDVRDVEVTVTPIKDEAESAPMECP